MQECPHCGRNTQPDPEHSRAWWCLSCWRAWTLPALAGCSGTIRPLTPGLRLLAESRELNR